MAKEDVERGGGWEVDEIEEVNLAWNAILFIPYA